MYAYITELEGPPPPSCNAGANEKYYVTLAPRMTPFPLIM